jgi:peroxiredoxin
MIKVGDALPAATLMEYSEVEGNGCSIGPNPVDVAKASAGKTIALFALPGAFTPTCSAKHVPGYVTHFDDLKKAGVDEIWCVSVNDAFVMGAWPVNSTPQAKCACSVTAAPTSPKRPV